MASANLDLVRSLFEDWERAAFRWTDWADPDIDFVVVDGPTPGTWHGISEMMLGLSDYLSAWEGYHVMPEEYRELDGERIRQTSATVSRSFRGPDAVSFPRKNSKPRHG